MRPTICVAILCICAFTGFVAKAGPQTHVVVYGVGGKSCGLWVEAREGAKRDRMDIREMQFESWVHGFLSGYNLWVPEAPAKGIFKTDAAGASAFLDKFCRDNPTATFVGAVSAFIKNQQAQ